MLLQVAFFAGLNVALAAVLAVAAQQQTAVPLDHAVDVLVRDFVAVERGDAPILLYESQTGQLMHRIIKDRFDLLFTTTCRTQGAQRETLFPDDAAAAIPSSLAFLDNMRSSTFISTEMGVRQCTPGADFQEHARQLQAMRTTTLPATVAVPAPATPPSFASQQMYVNTALDEQDGLPDIDRLSALRCLFNTTCLPTHAQVARVFPWLGPDYTLLQLSTEDLVRPWRSRIEYDLLTPLSWIYFYSNSFFRVCDVLTHEYVDALAQYLAGRLRAIGDHVTVLEIGAGNGRLVHFLSRALPSDVASRVTFVATDAAGNVGDATMRFPVLKQDHKVALRVHKPHIVIASWMSKDVDWTAEIRSTPTVHEYILIGEKDYGVCGSPKDTWGVPRSNPLLPWQRDGFQRHDLDNLSLLQIARTDSPYVRFHSHTVSFRRRENYNK